MHLQRIEAFNFRNLSDALEFGPGLNVIYGQNAQGKTAWLEAVYLLATTKSFRTNHPKDAIRHGEKEAILRGTVARGNLTKDLQMLITATTKQSFVNGKREAAARYLGNLDAVAFTADELDVVRGAPEARRRFLDRGLVSTLPSYLGTLAEYNRVLKQKNALLREAAEANDLNRYVTLLEPWNDQLVALGTEIHAARLAYVTKLQSHLNPKLFQHEQLTLRYKSALEGKGDLSDYAALMRERMALRLKNEISLGYALVGPHRDDLEIRFDGYETGKFGSSGQQRSALLILDLAQLSVYYAASEEYPLFLIDDIDAELDQQRIGLLLDYLEGKAQTLVSTSKRTIAERYRTRARTIQIVEGKAVSDEGQDDQQTEILASSEPETVPDQQIPELVTHPVTTPALAETKKGDSQDWLQQDAQAADTIPDDQDKYRAPF